MMKKEFKKLIAFIILCIFAANIFVPYFARAEILLANSTTQAGASVQDTSLIQSPRQILFDQIEKLSNLPEPFYDLKPSYDEKVKQVKITLTKAMNYFDSDTTIVDQNFFDYIGKAVRKLEHYLNHENIKEDVVPAIEEIRTSCILTQGWL